MEIVYFVKTHHIFMILNDFYESVAKFCCSDFLKIKPAHFFAFWMYGGATASKTQRDAGTRSTKSDQALRPPLKIGLKSSHLPPSQHRYKTPKESEQGSR